MRWVTLPTVTAALMGVVWASPAREKDADPPRAAREFADAVKIEFPEGGYAFTPAEAARGITVRYKIVVARDCEGVVPLPGGPSFREPPGPSGLRPREQVSGNGQLYCLLDFGLAPPPKEVVRTVKKGAYAHSFEWDGRNWTGPSDFGNPKGKPFPAGTYDVTVTLRGKLVSGAGKVPYEITGKAKVVLK